MSEEEMLLLTNQWIIGASIHGSKSGFKPERLAQVIRIDRADSDQIVERLIVEGLLERGKRSLFYLTAKGHNAANAIKSFPS